MSGGLVLSVILARQLGPNAFGQYNYILSFVTLCVPLFSLGMLNILLREFARHPEKSPSILNTCLTGRLVAGVLFSLLAIIIFYIFDSSSWKLQPLAILLVANISNAFEVYERWFQHKSNNRIVVYWRICCFVFFALLKIFYIWRYQEILPLIVIISLEVIVKNLGYQYLYRHFYNSPRAGSFDWKIFSDIFSQTKFLIFSSLAAVIYLKIDILMLEAMTSVHEVGVYSVASKLSEVWFILPQVMITAFFPKLLNIAQSNKAHYQRLLQQGFDILFICALALSMVVSAIAPWAIATLYGERYTESIPILRLQIFSCLFIFMRALLSQWLVSERFAEFSLYSQLSGAVSNVLLNLILIPLYGPWGAAVATLISYSIASYFCLILTKRTRKIALMMTKAIFFPFRIRDILNAKY